MMNRYSLTSSQVGQRLRILADQLSQSSSPSQFIRPFSSSAHGSHSNATSNAEVLLEPHGHAELVTLNKPASLNALNMNMVRLMYPAYRSFLKSHAHGHSGKTIILKGAGGKAFCAGGDVVALYQQHKNGESVEKVCQFFKEEYKLNYTISLLPAHVAILNGITMGGGVGVSILGKYRVATDNTLFAMPETTIGFFCDVGGSYFLPRLPGHLGMYLGLTGHRLKGFDVFASGVATHFVPQTKLEDLQHKLIRSKSPEEVKEILDSFHEPNHAAPILAIQPLVDKVFSKKTIEEIVESLIALEKEKENPISADWAKTTLSALKHSSPTSLKVVQEQLRRGGKLPLNECLKMEFRLAQKFVSSGEFAEGVRALLVDKDKNPNWKPKTLSDVSEKIVAEHFAPVKNELEFDP